MLGLLPVLIHGQARDICIIGLGSGVTLGSALAPGVVEHADVVEISPEVVEASHFFDRENGGALAKPGVRLIVGDGRSHLLLTPQRYDVIVSEPSNPWMAGVASLFTREFFEAARARLKPDGLLCQWAHTYDISPRGPAVDRRGRSRSVFPQGTMWMVGEGDLLLIGARDGDDPAAARRRSTPAAGTGDAPRRWRTSASPTARAAFALLSLFAGGPRELERYGAGALIQTDDRTALEYSAPRGIYGRSRRGQRAPPSARWRPNRRPRSATPSPRATDADWTSRGAMELKAQAFAQAYDAFRQAVTLNSRNAAALVGPVGRGRRRAASWTRNVSGCAKSPTREPANAAVRIELSRVLAVDRRRPGRARDGVGGACDLRPDEPRAAEQLASVLADAGDAERLGAAGGRDGRPLSRPAGSAVLPGDRAVPARPNRGRGDGRAPGGRGAAGPRPGAEPARRGVRRRSAGANARSPRSPRRSARTRATRRATSTPVCSACSREIRPRPPTISPAR